MKSKRMKTEPGIWRTEYGRYQVHYRDPSGNQRSKTFERLVDARDFKAAIRREVRTGTYVEPGKSKERFEHFAMQWLKTKVSKKPKTYASYESALRVHVIPEFGKKALIAIHREDIQAWIAKMQSGGKSAAVIRRAYQVLAAILTEAELSRRIQRSPAFKIERPSVEKGAQRFLTPAQVRQLAEAITPRFRALILMAAYTGLRWAELVGLLVEDLDLLHGRAIIRGTITEVSGKLHEADTKSHRVFVIPLPNFLCRELDAHIAEYAGDDGRVFTSPKGHLLRHKNFYDRQFKPALIAAELDPKLRFHDLRHTAASIAGSKRYGGESAKVVQQLLNHSTQQVTTEVYTHLFPEDLERLRSNLDRVFHEAEAQEESEPVDDNIAADTSTSAVASLDTRRTRR